MDSDKKVLRLLEQQGGRKCLYNGGSENALMVRVGGWGTVCSDVTLRENWPVFIRCRTMPVGAALAL